MEDNRFDERLKQKFQEDKYIPENINQLFSNFEMEVNKMEKENKTINKVKKRVKFSYIVAWIAGILGGCSVVYATVFPQEWKENISKIINSYFGVEISANEYSGGVQDKTLNEIIETTVENKEKYSQLLDETIYDIGDSNGGTLIESNYKQYDFDLNNEEDEIVLEKYSDIINIKMGMINYSCLEKIDSENTIFDENGTVISRTEPSLEKQLNYQYNEFSNNWEEYYYGKDGKNKDLYFKITGMTLMNGNNSTDENFTDYARAKKIKITFNGENEEIINLLDTKKAQFIDLSFVQKDISKPVDIKIEVLEKYNGTQYDDIYIADIQFGMTSNIPQGR